MVLAKAVAGASGSARAGSAALRVENLTVEYVDNAGKAVVATRELCFEVTPGKLFTLLGPSGCGKTTTMRAIAGLERPVSGTISVGDDVVSCTARGIFVAPNRRNFGMVFQSYAIWPHMNVFENAAFPLRVGARRMSRAQIDDKVNRALHVVGLDAYAAREATQLSGGQQQRLALARALVMEPRLLLLDEPLSNLDAKLRERMRVELKRLQYDLGLTTIYVTHDQAEALALSTRIAVMSDGRLMQIGTPREIYQQPANRFVADFVGMTNFIEATIVGAAGPEHLHVADTPLGRLTVHATTPLAAGTVVQVSVRPEDVTLSETRPTAHLANVLEGVVDMKEFIGEAVDFQVRVGERPLMARAHPNLRTPLDAPIFIHLDPEKCICVPG